MTPVLNKRTAMASKVLIVDDEPNIVVPLQFLMEQNGYDVRVAENGQTALDLIGTFRPDIILLDIMLPDKSGFELCQILRDDLKVKDARIVMVTALGRDIDIAKGLALGADAFVTKPFSNAEIVNIVKRLLDGPR
jgi:DNA-binding response OmpR family regulator